MTAREVLEQIEQRTEKALRPGTSVYRALDKTVIDNRLLVAALRAVLDLHEPTTDQRYTCGECEYFSPCPTQRAIASALGSSLGGGA